MEGAEFIGYVRKRIISGDNPDLWDAIYNWKHGGERKVVEWYAYYGGASSEFYWANKNGYYEARYKYRFDSSTGIITGLSSGERVYYNNGSWGPWHDSSFKTSLSLNTYNNALRHWWDSLYETPHEADNYYAVWAKRKGFNITFNVNGGSINISNQVALDITLPNPGTRPGYTFDGWYNGDKKIGGMGDKWKPTADTTITAKWNVITYHISYVLYEGTLNGSNPITYTVETPTITLVNPTQDKKRFTGWSDWNNSKPRNPYTIPKGTIGDLIISANWEVDTSNKPNVRDNVFHGSSNIVSNRFTIEVP